MKKIILSIIFIATVFTANGQKMVQLFNGYLSNMTQTGQGTIVENNITYNTYNFIGSFNNDLGQYDGSEINSIAQDKFMAVTVDGAVYELKISTVTGGSILQGTVIDYSNELTALPAGNAAIYVKTQNTLFPASTAGLSVELREAIDNYFKTLIDKSSNACLRRVTLPAAHGLSVGDFVVVLNENEYAEATTTTIPNGVVVDVENQLTFTFATCGLFNTTDFSVLGLIQWNGISDGEYIHTLITGEQYRMFEKWGTKVTIDGPYAKNTLIVATNGLTQTNVPGGKLIEFGGDLNKNTALNGDKQFNLVIYNNLKNLITTDTEPNVNLALSHYYNSSLIANNTELAFSYLRQNNDDFNLGSVIDEAASGNYYYQYIDFNSLEKGGLFLQSDNYVSSTRYIKTLGLRNADNTIYLSNKNENTGEEVVVSLLPNKLMLKTPNIRTTTATTGQYLKLIDQLTGEVEFADVTAVETDPVWTLEKPFYLGDVVLDNPVNDQILVYSNGSWVNVTPSTTSSLGDLTDVTLTDPITTNQVLQYNGTEWFNATLPTGTTGITGITGTNGIATIDNGDGTYTVKIDGNLTEATTFNAGAFALGLTSSSSIVLENDVNNSITLSSTGTVIKGDAIIRAGDLQLFDYGQGNYITSSPAYLLTTTAGGDVREYAISSLPKTAITQSNGLTVTPGTNTYNVKLGGALTETTNIAGGANNFTLESTGSIKFINNAADFIELAVTGTSIVGNLYIAGGTVQFDAYGAGAVTGTLTKLAGFDTDGFLIEVDPSTIGGTTSLALEDLTNVTINTGTLTANQVLKYNGTAWVNAADEIGDANSGVASVSATNGLTASGSATNPIISLGGILGATTTINGIDAYGMILNNLTSLTIDAADLFLTTSSVTSASASVGQALKLINLSTGEVEFANDINFANTNLGIGENRTHTINAASFTIQGTGATLINITPDDALIIGEVSDYDLIPDSKTGIFMDSNEGLTSDILIYSDIITSLGTVNFYDYGSGNKTAAVLQVNDAENYVLGVAVDGTVYERVDVLDNVNLTAPAEGEILRYNATAEEWVNTALPTIDPSSINVEDLGNVTVANVADKQLLQYNNAEGVWKNVGYLLDDIVNVNVAGASDGQVLKFDLASNTWIAANDNTSTGTGVNQTLSINSVTAALSITDGNTVDLSEAIDNQVNALITAGTNIVKTYNDVANSMEIKTTDALTAIDAITFDNNTTTEVANKLQFNPDYGTMTFGMTNNTPIRVGQDIGWLVKNQSGTAIPKGTAVMAVGTVGASGRILIDELIADGSVDAHYFLGVTAETIADGADGFVTSQGHIRGINISAFPNGTVLYADPANPGGFTATEPTSGNLKLPLAFVINSASNGEIAVRADVGASIKDLHDVDITGVINNSILKYDGTKWVVGTDNSESTTVSNGLTLSGVDVQLGGNLTRNTSVLTTDYTLYIGDTDANIFIQENISRLQLTGTVNFPSYTGTNQIVTTGHISDPQPQIGINSYSYFLAINEYGVMKKVEPEIGILKDVVITNAAENEILQYNGTDWVNAALPSSGSNSLNDLTDVTISTLSTGQVLKYNGTTWVNDVDAVNDADADPTNELQDLTLTGTTLSLTNDATTVDLSGFLQNTLSADATITGNTNDYIYNSIDNFEVNLTGNKTLFLGHSKMYIDFSALEMKLYSSDQPINLSSPAGIKFENHGLGTKEAGDFTPIKTASAYIAGFATDGTLIDVPISSIGGGTSLTDFSVTTNAAGNSALSYNNTNGVFTFTPPDLSGYLTSEVDGSLSNEGSLTVGSGDASSSTIVSNTSGSTPVYIAVGTGLSISELSMPDNRIILTNTAPEATTASNGLTKVGNNVKLGGTLTEATYIDARSNPFSIYTGNGGESALQIFSDGTTALYSTNNKNLIIGSFASGGSIDILNYGEGLKEATDFSPNKVVNYLAGIATDGTLIDVPISSIGGGIDLTDLSVTTAAPGTSSLTYNNTNGVFTFTPPNLSSYLTSEVDGSITNEGALSVTVGTSTTSVINSNTSGSAAITLLASTGLSIGETGNTITLTNTAPDQTVSLTGAGITAISGTYPNFTITSTEVDGSVSNEGALTVGLATGTTATISSNTSGSMPVTIEAGPGLAISETGNTIKLELGNTVFSESKTINQGPYSLVFTGVAGNILSSTTTDVTINKYFRLPAYGSPTNAQGDPYGKDYILSTGETPTNYLLGFSEEGTVYRVPFINNITTPTVNTSVTVNFQDYYQKIIRYDLSSFSGTMTLSFSNPEHAAIYTFHFINANGKTIDWPSNCYTEDGVTAMPNTTFTTGGQMFTMYYDTNTARYYVK